MTTRRQFRSDAISCLASGVLLGLGIAMLVEAVGSPRPIHTSLLVFLVLAALSAAMSVRRLMRHAPGKADDTQAPTSPQG